MTIAIGDSLPQATFRIMTPDGPAAKTTDDVFKGRTVVLVSVVGAFTPTCHSNHLVGYVNHYDDFRAKGIDAILVTSVNDVFVQDAWAKASHAVGKIEFLSDGNADFAKLTGLVLDASGFGLGLRSQRYAMLVKDGVVEALNIEDTPAKADISSARALLEQL
jgi:glutaredoxin/glutathione-dependent peroxiredoxin